MAASFFTFHNSKGERAAALGIVDEGDGGGTVEFQGICPDGFGEGAPSWPCRRRCWCCCYCYCCCCSYDVAGWMMCLLCVHALFWCCFCKSAANRVKGMYHMYCFVLTNILIRNKIVALHSNTFIKVYLQINKTIRESILVGLERKKYPKQVLMSIVTPELVL